DYDFAYSTFVENRADVCEQWRFFPLGKRVCTGLGFGTKREATRALGADGVEREIARFALEYHTNVVRFAQPRYEAVSLEARRWIDRSKREPERVFCLERPGFKPMFLRGGNRILFLSDKVRKGGDGDRPVLVEPLTSVWDDVPF